MAIQHFDKALLINKNDEKSWSARGFAYIMKKDYDQALHSFEQAIVVNPQNAENWINKASVLKVMGKESEANVAIDKANLLYKEQEKDISKKIPRA